MVTLTGFADEISPDLDVQLDTLEALGIRHLEFRGVWDKNVLDLSPDELNTVRSTLRRRGFCVSAIGSPIGKVPIGADFAQYTPRIQQAIDTALRMETPYVRVFSYYVNDLDRDRAEVMRRMQTMVDMAAVAGVTLLHENEKGIYGELPERCLDLHQTIKGSRLRATFDPANFVLAGVRPFADAYRLLRPYVEYLHIKDAVLSEGRVVPAGEGSGQIRELMAALTATGYSGFLSLEPHLQVAGRASGFSGPELFGTAVKALRAILDDLGITTQ
jgi:3-dehydroshikimate dehydratase